MSDGAASGSYDPKRVEPEIYALWEQGAYFHADPDPAREPFTIVIPPPNVTGALHLGHALNNTLQDILIRRKRMQGYNACWLPGTDHAGIATQAVVERRLREEQGKTRHELGRAGLVERIWKWKDDYEARILGQLRRMGCSCDWRRTRFTLDEGCAQAVYETFFRMFRDGLIYRGLRLVNWDCELQTAVADDEVYHEPVKGHLWHFRYAVLGSAGVSPAERHEGTEARRHEGEEVEGSSGPGVEGRSGEHGPPARATGTGAPPTAADLRTADVDPEAARAAIERATRAGAQPGSDYLVVATTRPETMLGDTALAVHPEDERYKRLIGQRVLLPLMNRAISIIADGKLVQKEFGTGCVKVTPAHDPNDYECGVRNGLEMINVMTPDGRINERGRGAAGPRGEGRERGSEAARGAAAAGLGPLDPWPLGPFDYSGLGRFEARQRVVADLESLGLLDKVENYETDIGHSDRSKSPIEPLLSEQWFVRMDKPGGPRLAELALEAVRDGRVRFFPERYAKTYLDWLGEKRDWCISRQLWWGHRIPVWKSMLSDHAAGAGSELSSEDILDKCRESRAELQSALQQWAKAAHMPGAFCLGPFDEERPSIVRICARDGAAARELEEIRALSARHVARGEPDRHLPAASLSTDPRHEAGRRLGGILSLGTLEQDPDVLDTWFSSQLWPHSTFGWPSGEARRHEGTKARSEGSEASPSVPSCLSACVPDRHYFYPTNVLSTARDIITLWVARMVMSGLYNMGRVPFQHVCIHPTIQDGRGRRMSKSAGNGLDPVDLIERYGADALRLSLAGMAGATQDVRVPISYLCPHCQATFAQAEKHLGKEVVRCEACQRDFATRLASEAKIAELGLGLAVSERFEEGQRFCNKLWQAATGFVLPNLRSDEGKAGCRDIGTEGRRDAGTQGHRDEGTEGRRDEGATGSVGVPPARPGGAAPLEVASLPLEDRWILSRLAACVAKVDAAIAGYQYSDAAGAIYSFFWSEFCDWYVELVKPRLYEERDEGTEGRRDGGAPSAPGDLGIERARDQGSEAGEREPAARASADAARQVLAFTLDQTLRLLHPIAPFVTEALWRRLNDVAPRRGVDALYDAEKVLIRARWPSGSDRLATGSTDQDADRTGGRLAAGPADSDTGRARARSETGAIVHPEWRDAAVEDEMAALQEVIRATRDVRTQINKLRAQAKQPSLRSLPQVIIRADAAGAARLAGRVAVLKRLGRCAAFEIGPDVARPSECFARVLGHAEVYVPVAGLADLAIERQRLTQEREELAGHARRIEGKLANEGFVSKAPAEVVAKERQRLDELRQRIDALEQNLREFGGA